MTTRKASACGAADRWRIPLAGRRAAAVFAGAIALVALAGCATPGPVHVYSVPGGGAAEVRDRGPEGEASVATFLERGERITGFAYDPFTDHFFLRLEPGNRIRVVDRPARAIKREFEIDGVPAEGGGDLAVRPRDGHLFLLHPQEPAVLETNRFGDLRRTIRLEGVPGPGAGIAYDAAADELLVLHAGGVRVTRHAMDGAGRGGWTLAQPVGPSCAYDSAAREFYAPLTGQAGVGVFDVSGKRVRTLPTGAEFVDLGMRSFVRVF